LCSQVDRLIARSDCRSGHDSKALKTTSFNISTKHDSYRDDNNRWKQKFLGYSCEHDLSLEFDLDIPKLGITLGAIASCKATPQFNIHFSVKDTNAVSEQLLKNAIENAKFKAAILAKAAGVSLGAIKRIDYNWSELRLYAETIVRVKAPTVRKNDAEPMQMDVEPENIDANESVTVVWDIS